MPRASPGQLSFNAGIWSPNLEGRVDLAKYGASVRELRNFVPRIAGPAQKRSGTRFVNEVKDSTKNTRLVSFEFGVEQAYILEFGDLYMRVYRDGGIVLDGGGPAVFEMVTPYAHGDLDGLYFTQSADVLFVVHPDYAPRQIKRMDHDDWTIEKLQSVQHFQPFMPENFDELDGAAASAQSGGGITLTSGGGHFVASMVGGNFKLREVVGSEHGEWEAASANTDYDGSFGLNATRFWEQNVYRKLDTNTPSGTSPPIHKRGVKTDGKVDWAYEHSGAGYAQITSVISPFRATADVKRKIPASCVSADITISNITQANPAVVTTSAPHNMKSGDLVYIEGVIGMTEVNQKQYGINFLSTTTFELNGIDSTGFSAYSAGGFMVRLRHRWAHGAFSDWAGYPTATTFYEDRLVFAGTKRLPQGIWLSRTGDYLDFETDDTDEGSLLFVLNTDKVNAIEWLVARDALHIGTRAAEHVLSASNTSEALTAGNVRAQRRTTRGSKPQVAPVLVGSSLLFVQRSGRKLIELLLDDESDSETTADDLTVLADTVVQTGIRKMAYQQEPHRVIWCVLDDGQLVAFSYEREQQVAAWHRHPLGGTDVVVESVAVIPHQDGDGDQVWLVVKRTIDGSTVRYVEFIEKDWLEVYDLEDAFFVDCGLTYSGSPATVISGLDHLEGETVKVLADGAVHPPRVVSSGSITLAYSASDVQAGLAYAGEMESMRPEAGSAEGTSQGKTKRIQRAVFRLYQCGAAFEYGKALDDLTLYEFRKPSDPMDEPVPLFDGDTERLVWPPGYDSDARVAFRHDSPLPCTVTGIFPQLATQDGG